MLTACNNYSMWRGFFSGPESVGALPTAVAHSLQNSPKGRSIFSVAVKTDLALMKIEVTSAIDLTDTETQLVGQHLHCSGSTLCFLSLQQSPEGCAVLSSPLSTRMEQVLLPADLCLIVNWSFPKDMVAVSASLYCVLSNKVWAVATLFSQLQNLRGLCLLFNG